MLAILAFTLVEMRVTRYGGVIAVTGAALAVVTAAFVPWVCGAGACHAAPLSHQAAAAAQPERVTEPDVSATLSPSATLVPTPAAATPIAFAKVNPEQGEASFLRRRAGSVN